jgi:hypothetical protein
MAEKEKADTNIHESTNDSKPIDKVIIDFISDLHRSFPEAKDDLLKLFDNEQKLLLEPILENLKNEYPKHFFDIIYENENIFSINDDKDNNEDNNEDNDEEYEPLYFLPNIDFKKLWNLEGVSEKTKEAIWKYLQLILLSTVGDLKENDMFGDTSKLFESINEEDFKSKLENCMEQLQGMFKSKEMEEMMSNMQEDLSGAELPFSSDASSNINLEDILPDADELHSHISQLMDGKIGRLAEEIAEETAKELDVDLENLENTDDMFKKIFQNPKKLMNIVKKIGGKLDSKMKSGELNQEELVNEAGEMMEKFKNMPGMDEIMKKMGGKDLEKMMKEMGGAGGITEMLKQMSGNKNARFNQGAFTQHMKANDTKQRLLKKLEERRNAQIAQAIRDKIAADKQQEELAAKHIELSDDWLEEFQKTNDKANATSTQNKKKKKKKNKKKN